MAFGILVKTWKGQLVIQHRLKPQHEVSNCKHLRDLSLIRGQVVLGLCIGNILITDTEENTKIISDRVFRGHWDWAWRKSYKKKGSEYWYKERERENNLFSYGKVIHPRIKSYSNATEELMTVQKWWQSCGQAQRMALLRSLVLAFCYSNKKFIGMASKYSHGLSIAAIQGKPVLGINSGKSCSLWEGQARWSLTICGAVKKEMTIQTRKSQGEGKRSAQAWKYCCRCHNSHNIWRVLR